MADDLINRYNNLTNRWERVPRTIGHTPGARAATQIIFPLKAKPSEIGQDEGKKVPSYRGGSVRSVQALANCSFDPIYELVKQYRTLEREVAWYEQLREGEITPLKPDGKPYVYNSEYHLKVFERLEAIGAQLLRYGYGRVSETLDLNVNRPTKLVFNLSKKGDTFEINTDDEEEQQGNPDGD